MSELDTIAVYNPLDEDFSVRFNGELYKVPSKSEKHFPQFLAMHVAKHLSDVLLAPDLAKLKKENKGGVNTFNPKNAQLVIYDNPKRRIALYQILRSKEYVQSCIEAFPFKGFIGEMAEYDKFVEKQTSPKPGKPKAEE